MVDDNKNKITNEVGNGIERGVEKGAQGVQNTLHKMFKKLKENTKQAFQIIWNMIPLKYRLIIIAVIAVIAILFILVCAAALFILDISANETSTSDLYSSIVQMQEENIIINTLSTEEIESFISNYDTSNILLKTEMLKNTNKINNWQSKTNYSATLLITIAFEENIDENSLSSFINTMEVTAKEWETSGYKTIQEIADAYIGDDTSVEWANIITDKIYANCVNSGIYLYGEYPAQGDGYDSIYISRDGKVFRNYKQINTTTNSYYLKEWFDDEDKITGENTIKENGCSLVSTAIIISGYKDIDISPYKLATENDGKNVVNTGMHFGNALSYYGISLSVINPKGEEFNNQEKKVLKSYLKQGKSIILYVLSPSDFTRSQHFIALLDYNPANDTIYVSNPANNGDKTGWIDSEKVLKTSVRYFVIH